MAGTPPRKHIGRPAIPAKKRRENRIVVRCTDAEVEDCKKRAKVAGFDDVSAWARARLGLPERA